MRYESFYPFARQQSAPFSHGQPGYGTPPPPANRMTGGQTPFRGFGGPSGNSMQGSAFSMQEGPPGAQGTSKMESYMQTANRFLNTAQQYAPVVQQFAPMMQNLPAMWKLYKGFQSLPAAGAPTGGPLPPTGQSLAQSTSPGLSIPRIFQPPV